MLKHPDTPSRIYEYLDYREFLRVQYKLRNGENRSFSYRYIGGKVGLDSGSVSRILHGQRHLDPGLSDKMAAVFRLPSREREFFAALVQYGWARTDSERNHILERIFRLRNLTAKLLSGNQFRLYQKWYNLALWSMLSLSDSKADPTGLAARLRPNISPTDAQKSLELLKAIGLVEDKDGDLSVTEKIVTSGDQIQAVHVNNLHMEMGWLAAQALNQIPPQERDFSGMMLTLSEDGFRKTKRKIKELRQELMEIARQDETANCSYRMNLQLFPVTYPQQGAGI